MDATNILVTTLGKFYDLVPELLGFTNPEQLPLYDQHPESETLSRARKVYDIKPVTAVWLITTDGNKAVTKMVNWFDTLNQAIEIKFFILKDHQDLTSAEDIKLMTDLIYRVAAQAHEVSQNGQVLLSLVGGRKTMSADMQQAGNLFGCHAMLHVIDNPRIRSYLPENFDYLSFLPEKFAAAFTPVVVSGAIPRNVLLDYPPAVRAADYGLSMNKQINYIRPDLKLVAEVERRQREARNLFFNYSLSLSGENQHTNYRALYGLPPAQIDKLKKRKIALKEDQRSDDLALLQRLPKAELHCHFGGILTPQEMIAVAGANGAQIEVWRNQDKRFDQWLTRIESIIKQQDVAALHLEIPNVKALRDQFPNIPKPLTVAAFLSLFDGQPDLLETFIFGDYLNPQRYQGVGFEQYERLGDLQGSALMQSEASIRQACRLLIEKCARDNVRYLELRQSPVKYTQGGLAPARVVEIIREELEKADQTTFRAIFIASRRGKMSEVHRHIELAQELFARDATYRDWIVGFDLAGAEGARKPSEMRPAFLPLMKESMNITIHAGENQAVQNIWEAVYDLNADRIGHGLTLNDNSRLKRRFLNRKITVEMCPSSNHQIVGYGNGKPAYPLKQYLQEGLRVTVNTDNPGISRTNFSNEYYKAAQLSEDGLSLWEILQLIRNGFKSAFLPFDQRQNLLIESEKEILTVLKDYDQA